MPMKPTREKRTTTQPGLGKVGAERRSTLGASAEVDPNSESVPISAPPPSGGNRFGRMTLPLEKAVVDDTPRPPASGPPASSPPAKPVSSERPNAAARASGGPHDPRADGDSGSGRIERVERVGSKPNRAAAAASVRPSVESASGDRRRAVERASSKPSAKAPSRPPHDLAKRASVGGFSAVEIATGRRAVSGTAGAPVALAVAGPARSKRVSIREDNIGKGITSVADAVGAAGRVVPRLLKSKAEIAAAPIDHRAGFLLAHVDGVTSVAGLVDICGMPQEEVELILERLRRLGIVAVR